MFSESSASDTVMHGCTPRLTLHYRLTFCSVFLSFSASPHLSLPHLEPFAAFPPDMTGEFKLSASGVNVCTSCSLPCSEVIVYSDDLGFVLLPSMRYLCSELRSLGLGRLFEVANLFLTYLRSQLGKMLKHGLSGCWTHEADLPQCDTIWHSRNSSSEITETSPSCRFRIVWLSFLHEKFQSIFAEHHPFCHSSQISLRLCQYCIIWCRWLFVAVQTKWVSCQFIFEASFSIQPC